VQYFNTYSTRDVHFIFFLSVLTLNNLHGHSLIMLVHADI